MTWVAQDLTCVAYYPFYARSIYELTFKPGDNILVKETSEGWYRGKNIRTRRVGIFPQDFVREVAKEEFEKTNHKTLDFNPIMEISPIQNEIIETLRYWRLQLSLEFKKKNWKNFAVLLNALRELFQLRKNLLLTNNTIKSNKSNIKNIVSFINAKHQELDLPKIPRIEKVFKATLQNSGFYGLYQQYSSTTDVKKKKVETTKSFVFQLMLDFQCVIVRMVGDAKVVFKLYDHSSKKFVSESYVVEITQFGLHKNIELHGKLRTILKDITEKELKSGQLYLVCHIQRWGYLLLDEKIMKKYKKHRDYRRPFAVGILKLTPELFDSCELETVEKTIDIFKSSEKFVYYKLHEMIIDKDSTIIPVENAVGVQIKLRSFKGEIENFGETIIGEDEVKLSELGITKKMNFPGVIYPADRRNDLYLEIVGGNFLQDRKRSPKNMKIRISVRPNKNWRGIIDNIQESISFGSNCEKTSMYESYVYYHKNDPLFKEHILINIPIEKYLDCHLYIEFIHSTTFEKKSNKLFAFTFIKLTDSDGIVLNQGKHVVTDIYKFIPKLAQATPLWYLTEPPPKQKSKIKSRLSLRKETFTFNLNLCSTTLTQIKEIYQLINYTKYQNLEQIFNKWTYVAPIEVMKFLPRILDVHFIVLGQKGEQMSAIVCKSLILLIRLIVNAHDTDYRPVLDHYIQTKFSSESTQNKENELTIYLSKIYPFLIAELATLLGTDLEKSFRKVIDPLRALDFLFKFILKSWSLHVELQPRTIDSTKFKKDLLSLFDQIIHILKFNKQQLLGAQATALKHLNTIFVQLRGIFDDEELPKLAFDLIDSVQLGKKTDLNCHKLRLLTTLVETGVLDMHSTRNRLVPLYNKLTKYHMKNGPKELSKCLLLLRTIFQRKLKTSQAQYHYINSFLQMLNLIFDAMDYNKQFLKDSEKKIKDQHAIEKQKMLEKEGNPNQQSNTGEGGNSNTIGGGGSSNKKNQIDDFGLQLIEFEKETQNKIREINEKYLRVKRKIISIAMQIFSVLTPNQFRILWEKDKQIKGGVILLLVNFNQLFISLIEEPIYSIGWENLLLAQLFIILKTLRMFYFLMRNILVNKDYAELYLWSSFFKSLSRFILCKNLQLEYMEKLEIQSIIEKYGDMRIEAINLLRQSWNSLQKHQLSFIQDNTKNFLSLILSPNERIKNIAMDLYYSVIKVESKHNPSLKLVEQGTIDVLAETIKLDRNEQFNKIFFPEIKLRFEKDISLKKQGKQFLEQLNLLNVQIHKLKEYPENHLYEEERTHIVLELLDYLKRTERIGMWSKYIHVLLSLHHKLTNYISGGMTLLPLIDSFKWDDNMIIEKMDEGKFLYPQEGSDQRKERLMFLAIDDFMKGKDWERAILLIHDLRDRYERKTLEYEKLGRVLKTESECWNNISKTERFYPSYYRVGYYGKGFDNEKYSALFNNEFIYRGAILEQLTVFIEKLKKKFPSAKIGPQDPTEKEFNSQEMYIQVSNVQPSSEEDKDNRKRDINPLLNSFSKKYIQMNNLYVFVHSKPFRKSKIKSKNEFKDLWLRNTYFITDGSFPSNTRRLRVKDRVDVELSPIQNAVSSVEEKNKDLILIIKKYQSSEEKNTNPFSMALNGVIDAAVNGGVFRYIDAFFGEEYIKNNTNDKDLVVQLKKGLQNQLNILDDGIYLHNKLCPTDFRPFHDKMVLQLKEIKKVLEPELIELLQSIEQDDYN
ncbi:dedicator of cytokinesis [Anaeramoeba flamelloides]|uniref:Dedicator of cytokinesis n=1 Tax=Anaeramoeba flamelloides TaxID=1746091 RepID=A0AAV7YB63_9EUKA|nr:dedicator of cytokinesis [Anaeramoeba flamelloides]